MITKDIKSQRRELAEEFVSEHCNFTHYTTEATPVIEKLVELFETAAQLQVLYKCSYCAAGSEDRREMLEHECIVHLKPLHVTKTIFGEEFTFYRFTSEEQITAFIVPRRLWRPTTAVWQGPGWYRMLEIDGENGYPAYTVLKPLSADDSAMLDAELGGVQAKLTIQDLLDSGRCAEVFSGIPHQHDQCPRCPQHHKTSE